MTTQKRNLSEFAQDQMGMDAGPEAGMAPEMDMMPAEPAGAEEVIGQHGEGPDREGAMAKADLYKLASYSHKLYQQIKDEDQLEAWVQAKITKAADYIASVYHFLEYEMKFSEYGKHLDNADTLSEGQKQLLKNRLMEAKKVVAELKKEQAAKVSARSAIGENVDGDKFGAEEKKSKKDEKKTEKSSTGGEITRSKGVVKHTAGKNYSGSGADVKENFDGDKFGAEEKKSKKDDKQPETRKSSTGGKIEKTPTGVKHTAGKNYSGKGAEVKENFDGDDFGAEEKKSKKDDKQPETRKSSTGGKIEKTPTGVKHTAGKNYSGKGAEVKEAAPSAGLSKAKKSATVKKAQAGGDIGKPGKNFDKVAKAAGGGKKGEKIAAAAMWKNIKEAVKSKKADKDYDGDGKVESGKDEHAGSVDKAIKASKKETVKESTDFTRMQDQLARLNRSETHVLKENSEADQIRALTKRLLG